VSQSVDCLHALGQVAAGRQSPETFEAMCSGPDDAVTPPSVVQQASPSCVLQSVDCLHCDGHAAAAVQIGCAKSVQHFGVPPEQSLSAEQCCWQLAVGAHTLVVEEGLAAQQDSPWSVWQSVSWLQKRGHACGATHALLPEPKSQQSCPCSVQSESPPQLLGQLPRQTD
jgi:hypothetical protein